MTLQAASFLQRLLNQAGAESHRLGGEEEEEGLLAGSQEPLEGWGLRGSLREGGAGAARGPDSAGRGGLGGGSGWGATGRQAGRKLRHKRSLAGWTGPFSSEPSERGLWTLRAVSPTLARAFQVVLIKLGALFGATTTHYSEPLTLAEMQSTPWSLKRCCEPPRTIRTISPTPRLSGQDPANDIRPLGVGPGISIS